MKRYAMSWIVLTSILAVGVAKAQTIQVSKDNRTIAITTSDTASAEADVATVHIGFFDYGPDQQTAYAEGSKISNAIAKALADAGVAKDTIQSDNQGISEVPQYEWNNLTPAERAQRKFKVQQSWTVKTSAENAAKVLNIAVNAGANQSGAIDWSLKDENALQAKAAGKALARARTIADQMAAGLGAKVGALIYASNQTQGPVFQPVGGIMGAIGGGPMERKATLPLAISPHKVEKSATVYAVFAIE
ncbi:MAG: SIMPL domain-containing protein [Acidobacteriaceae bacterium]